MAKNEVDSAIQKLLVMDQKKDETVKVYQNAAPTATFGAQTLSLDLSDAEFVDINTRFASGKHRVQRFKVGEDGTIGAENDNMSYTNMNFVRLIVVKTTGIDFKEAYFNNTKNNGYCIPESIYKVILGGVQLKAYLCRFLEVLQRGCRSCVA